MMRLYKVTTVFEVEEEEVLNYLGYSADSDYEPTDDEFEDEERLSIFDNVSPYDDEDDE